MAESAMMVSAGRRCTAAVAVLLDEWHGGKGARKANDGSTSTTTIKHNMIKPEHILIDYRTRDEKEDWLVLVKTGRFVGGDKFYSN